MKKYFLLFVTVCMCAAVLPAQSYRHSTYSLADLQALSRTLSKDKNAAIPTVSVKENAVKYIQSYYGRTDFLAPEWVRVKNFLTWLSQNETRLNKQFLEEVYLWAEQSNERKEILFGTWLGMKYAVDKIGKAPNKTFPIMLDQANWNKECNGYASQGKIYCNKGDFIERFNIGLHEAVHLLGADDFFRERYTVVSQQRYGLPVKLSAGWLSGTRTFFPVFESKHAVGLLDEYAEGIDALINYDLIWQQRQAWRIARNTTDPFEQRLLEEVFHQLELSDDKEFDMFYSAKANAYFKEVGKEIIEKYCSKFSPKLSPRSSIRACFEKYRTGILKISAEKLKPRVSKNIPPVPNGYM